MSRNTSAYGSIKLRTQSLLYLLYLYSSYAKSSYSMKASRQDIFYHISAETNFKKTNLRERTFDLTVLSTMFFIRPFVFSKASANPYYNYFAKIFLG